MTNEEMMQLMTEMGLHEGGMENWVFDNAWLRVANKAIQIEREECAKVADKWAVGWPHPSTVIAEEIRARGNT
jgi:hypothetical protein